MAGGYDCDLERSSCDPSQALASAAQAQALDVATGQAPSTVSQYPYVWAWKGHDTEQQRCCLRRQGQRCRVLVRGAMNSALIEFEDGFRTVTSRNGLRRA